MPEMTCIGGLNLTEKKQAPRSVKVGIHPTRRKDKNPKNYYITPICALRNL